jgi:hypothetical protein
LAGVSVRRRHRRSQALDDFDRDVIAGLSAALAALLPVFPVPASQPTLSVRPLRFEPAGIGGFVGLHDDPEGEVYARRLIAQAVVGLRAGDATALDGLAAQVMAATLGAGRAALSARGILRLTLTGASERKAVSDGDGDELAQELTFEVLYELLKLPDEAGDVIRTIPIDLEVG